MLNSVQETAALDKCDLDVMRCGAQKQKAKVGVAVRPPNSHITFTSVGCKRSYLADETLLSCN